MCSRYEVLTDLESIVAGEAVRVPPTDEQLRTFAPGEIRPTNLAPVILPGGMLAIMPWGLHVDWQSQPVINARAETLERKPTFNPLLSQRCVVPMSAYFEWRKAGPAKIKTRIHLAPDDHFACAGLVGDGRFTIITCAPAAAIAHIHDRMPVILDRFAQQTWLNINRSYADVKDVLEPYAGKLVFEEIAPPPHRQGELAL